MAPELPSSGHPGHFSTEEPPAGWVLYDGDCGVCSRWVTSWGPMLRRRGFAIAPLQSPWVQDRTGLPPADLLSNIRLLRPDGHLLTGPEVYRYLLRQIWWAYPLYLLSKVPGLSRLFDWGYRTFARHRTQISASCGLPPANLTPIPELPMNEEVFNLDLRKFLKRFGVTAQREIEQSVAAALERGTLKGTEALQVRATLTIPGLLPELHVDGEIALS